MVSEMPPLIDRSDAVIDSVENVGSNLLHRKLKSSLYSPCPGIPEKLISSSYIHSEIIQGIMNMHRTNRYSHRSQDTDDFVFHMYCTPILAVSS